MSTRATIACANEDGTFQATYLHYDGYPEFAGVILNQRFNSIEKVSALLAGGELRSLTSEAGGPEYLARARPPKHVCDTRSLLEFACNCDANYLYVFQNQTWQCQKL
jgi:hypothetical protein